MQKFETESSMALLGISSPSCEIDSRQVTEVVARIRTESSRNDSPVTEKELKQLFALTDLTTLSPVDNAKSVGRLAEKIRYLQKHAPLLPPLGGICIPGDAAARTAEVLRESPTRVSTVVNFPLGHSPLESVLREVEIRLEEGVGEIDLVFPLNRYLAGEPDEQLVEFVSSVKHCCMHHSAYLKTIIQSDELEVGARQGDQTVIDHIARLTRISFSGGSDLVKTSTGKGNGKGASLEAAATICLMAKCFRDQTNYQEVVGHAPGAKYSGGISDTKTASEFLRLHSEILGENALCCEMFRFGASRLVGTVLAEMLTCDSELAHQLAELEVDSAFFSESGSISRPTNY